MVDTEHTHKKLSTPANPSLGSGGYRIVRLSSGAYSVHSLAHAETFHPVVGPVAEAQALYVRQLNLPEWVQRHTEQFVIWDVGLGAAANPLTVLHALREVPCSICLRSFDHTLGPLEFALSNPEHLSYLSGHEPELRALLNRGHTRFREGLCSVDWCLHLGDFPASLQVPAASHIPKPHLILFDAFSPAKNPAMWTLPLFTNLFRLLDPARPCALPTYSRSTILRVTLLLAGFYVGAGHATGEKEETTVAANSMELIREPLDQRWLERAHRSSSAEPLVEPTYRQAPLSSENWEKLQAHLQFRR